MKKVLLTIALAAGVTSGYMADAATGWTLLGTQGARSFVVVDPALKANPAVFKEAAAAVCKPASPCVVLFWADAKQAAAKMPLSAAQSGALLAQYTRNPATGQDRLLMRCTGTEQPGQQCLK
jgi:hypothetical protein